MAEQVGGKKRSFEVNETAWNRASKKPSVSNGERLFRVLVIVVAVFWIYSPAMDGGWIWDDNFDITQPTAIQDPGGLWKIWFHPGSLIDYYPIKASVQWAQWKLWQNHTFGYHLTNVLLHIVSALLVWRLLSKFGLRLAWLGGLLFAIHPAQVESVAWIAELKNSLSLPPFLLAMCAFIDYENHGKQRDYFLAVVFFLVAMLCKPTMVMFPVVILLYVWWKRGCVGWSDLKISIPFFFISLALGVVTILVGNWYLHVHHASPDGATPVVIGGIFSRLALAGLSLSFYFAKCFWPVELMPMYPKWAVNPSSLLQFMPWLIMAGIIGWLWIKRTSWGRHALLGLGFFLINLMPFIGFITISYMDFTWVMDHFLYIPIIGLIGMVVAGLGEMGSQISARFRIFGMAMITMVMVLLAWKSHEHAKVFVNEKAFWAHTVQCNPGAWLAHNNLGSILGQEGRLSEAIEQFQQTLAINPNYAIAHNNMGLALARLDRGSEAIEQYELAIKIRPDFTDAHNNLGYALARDHRASEAIRQYELSLQIDPNNASARKYLSILRGIQAATPETDASVK